MINENTMTITSAGRDDLTEDKHILIALDETGSARRALLYVADFLGGYPGIRATLLRIIPEPSEDYFADCNERTAWIKGQYDKANEVLENYRDILTQSGFGRDKVAIKVSIINCASIAEAILEVQKTDGCCTVVVGRRAISRKVEFLFGSTTNRILHAQKNVLYGLWSKIEAPASSLCINVEAIF